MAGIFSWVTGSASSFYNYMKGTTSGVVDGAKKTATESVFITKETTGQIVSVAKTIAKDKELRKNAVTNVAQGWEGFSRSFNPSIATTILSKPKTRHVLGYSFYASLVAYLGTVWAYEYVIKSLMHNIPGMEEDSWGEHAVDNMAHWYFYRAAIELLTDKLLNNMSLNTAMQSEIPVGDNFPPCEDDAKEPTAIGQANLMSTGYFIGNQVVLSVIGAIPIVGKFAEWPLRVLSNGQELVQVKLAAAKQCTKHRYEILNANNPYVFGMGLSYDLAVRWWSDVIDHVFFNRTPCPVWQAPFKYLWGSRVVNPYIADAVAVFVYEWHMLAAMLITEPLPSKKPGVDVFYYSRQATQRVLKDVVDVVIPYIKEPENREKLIEKAQLMWNSHAAQAAKTIMLRKDLQTFPEFWQRPGSQLWLETHEPGIRGGIKYIEDLRNTPTMILYPYVQGFLPFSVISDKTRKVVNIILKDETENALKNAALFLDQVHSYAEPKPKSQMNEKPVFNDSYRTERVQPLKRIPIRPPREKGKLVFSSSMNVLPANSSSSEEVMKRQRDDKSESGLQKNGVFAKPSPAVQPKLQPTSLQRLYGKNL